MSAVRDAYIIARREFLERVRSKWFAIITLLAPIGMVAMIVIPGLIARSGSAGTIVEIVDECVTEKHAPCDLGAEFQDALEKGPEWNAKVVDAKTTDDELLERVRTSKINGFIRIPKDALEGDEITYRGDNASSQAVQLVLRIYLTPRVQGARARVRAVDRETAEYLLKPVVIEVKHTTGKTEGVSGLATFLVGYILAFLLYMIITLYGVGVMRAVVQEKTSRVMEMMVAAVKPNAMMGGKILGVGAAGLVQVAVWLAMGALSITYRAEIAGLFGVKGGGPSLPPLAGAEIAVVIAFFIVGFFFYAAMYAAVGAMVSSEQDTQYVQLPITLLLVIGMLMLQVIGNDPRGANQAFTMTPFWSPILMPMRFVLGGATVGEVLISLAILVASTLLVTAVAARIYRTGVLMYGKRPTLAELIRWLRY